MKFRRMWLPKLFWDSEMDFSLSSDQILFRDSIDRFFTDTFAADEGRDKAADWQALVDMGLTAAPFPESLGGTGANAIDLMFVANGIGRTLATVSFVSSVVLAGNILRDCASAPRARALIEALASGQARVAFARLESGAIRQSGSGWIVSGEARIVLDGADAQTLIVASPSADTLAIIDGKAAGLRRQKFSTLDHRDAADLVFADAAVAADSILVQGTEATTITDSAIRAARAAWCAEACGAMRAALELTLEYARTRKQFGRPIGSFQALQHRLVDIRMASDLADTMTRVATMAVDEASGPEAERLIAAASAQVASASRLVAEEAIQMHGGMGMTDECRAGKFAKRLMALTCLLGSEDEAVERFLGSA
jgi:alkylation response protein AidB-like acyl-CoA dehydrogenase